MQLDDTDLTQSARFEILPLIDVIFLLLVFFILIFMQMTMQRGISLELPQITEPKSTQKQSIQISITGTGDIAIEGKTVSIDELTQNIDKTKDLPIIIRGDQKAELGIALLVLEQLSLAGFSNIAFAADKISADSNAE